jgi:hypothetical protein
VLLQVVRKLFPHKIKTGKVNFMIQGIKQNVIDIEVIAGCALN